MEKIKLFLYNKENINSILIAALCMSGLMSFIINIDNIIPIITIIVLLALEVINFKETVSKIKRHRISYNVYAIIFVLAILLIFIISAINKGLRKTLIERFIYFIGFIIIPYICCRHKVNAKGIIYGILMISTALTIPLMFKKLGYYNSGTRMAISYYMLPTYLAVIMHFYINKNNGIKKILIEILLCILIFLPYWMFLFGYASRGIFLSIFVCVLLCSIEKLKMKYKVMALSITIFLAIVWVFFQGPILKSAKEVLGSFNISIGAINKNVDLYERGKIDNGRNAVFEKTIKGIMESPIIGNGIGDYAEKYVTYPHNIVLQAWYEGGIPFLVLILWLLLHSVYTILFDTKIEEDKRFLLILFFSMTIIRLMLSYEFWKEIPFGIYLYFTLYGINNNWLVRRKRNGNSNNSNI